MTESERRRQKFLLLAVARSWKRTAARNTVLSG